MSAEDIARGLSYHMRSILVAHAGAPQPIDYTIRTGDSNTRKTTASLISRELIRTDGGDIRRPRFTVLTELGREVVGYVLGEAADFLVSSGCLERSVIAEARARVAAKALDVIPGSDKTDPAIALVS